jgi:hypothetical protein
MRYLTLWRPASGEEGGMPDPAHMAEMGKMVEEWQAKGRLIVTEPIGMRATGARVRLSGGTYTVTDEDQRMAGYAFLNAASREEAITLAKTFMAVAGEGEVEIRQVLEFAPQPEPA